MTFALLPAIDVAGGRLAVLARNRPQPVDAFDGDPVNAASAFARAGCAWVHVVDMDLAFTGVVAAADVISRIRAAHPDVRIQVSGGIRTAAEATGFLDAGAARVVVGSAALADEDAAGELLRRLGDRALVGLEVEDGAIRSRGKDSVSLDLMATLGWLSAIDAPAYLVTSVSRVGGLAGPDVELIRRVARAGRPVLAAGGIRSLEDLRAARQAGAVGAVVGRAALEGSLDLGEALAWATA